MTRMNVRHGKSRRRCRSSHRLWKHVQPVRMDDGVALPSPAPPGGLRLRHRDVLVAGHRPRCRNPDHRHVGDERVPRGADEAHPRAQRASEPLCQQHQPHRLRRRRRTGGRRSWRALGRAGGRGAGDGNRQHGGTRRPGPRYAPGGSAPASDRRRQHRRRLAGRLRGRRRRGCRQQARRADGDRRRRRHHPDLAAGQRHRLRHRADGQELRGGGHFQHRHVRVRLELRLHAAGGGADLLPHAGRGDQPGDHRPRRRARRRRWPATSAPRPAG